MATEQEIEAATTAIYTQYRYMSSGSSRDRWREAAKAALNAAEQVRGGAHVSRETSAPGG